MVKRGGVRKKKRPQKMRPTEEPVASGFSFSKLAALFNLSSDGAMVVLGIVQLALGLVLLALLANFYNPAIANPLANSADQIVSAPERPFSPFLAWGFAIFTVCIWVLALLRRRKIGPRQMHFLTILYLPGTFMALWILYRFFAAAGGGN